MRKRVHTSINEVTPQGNGDILLKNIAINHTLRKVIINVVKYSSLQDMEARSMLVTTLTSEFTSKVEKMPTTMITKMLAKMKKMPCCELSNRILNSVAHSHHQGAKIGVQPTAPSRRKSAYRGNTALAGGRPAKMGNVGEQPKSRPHVLGVNVENNVDNWRKH